MKEDDTNNDTLAADDSASTAPAVDEENVAEDEPTHEINDEASEDSTEEPSDNTADDAADEGAGEPADEADNGLGSEEANDQKTADPAKKPSKLKRFGQAYWAKKLWTIPLTILALACLLLLIPATRYAIAGLFIKKDVAVTVTDNQSGKPISAATVTVGGKSGSTDTTGVAKVAGVKPGPTTIQVTKQYYQSTSQAYTVPVGNEKTPPQIKLQATGRQVPVVVKNKIGGAALADVTIKVLDTQVKTDKDGKAVIVVPVGKDKLEGTLTASGYNDVAITLTVTEQADPLNTFTMVPAGKVYFLSKLSGKIDVVKTNLDGSARQTVVAGTGKEDNADTVLLASRDWKYLVLKSKRDGSLAKLFLIDTATDKLTTMDEGDAIFNMIGWQNHVFTYSVSRNAVQNWQAKKTALKGYNADNGQLLTMYETGATGDQNNYAYETITWNYAVGTNLVFFTTWVAIHANYSTTFSELDGKQAQTISMALDGKKTVLKALNLNPSAGSYGSTYYNPVNAYESALYEPNEIYYAATTTNDQKTTYYMVASGKVTDNSDEAKKFLESDATYPTYLLSPAGNQTFWSEARDGKNTLFIGDSNGQSGKQIAALSEFTPYGWYTDGYLLVSKSGSELYVMPSAPTDAAAQAIKVTDYHKPTYNYKGYGGGYGGL